MATPGRSMTVDRELARAWQGVLGRLAFDVSPLNFEPWLRPTVPIGFEGDTVLIRTPHPFHRDWLQQQFGTVLRRALIGELQRDVDVRFVGDVPPEEHGSRPAAERPGGVNRYLTFQTYLPASGNRQGLQACRDLLIGEGQPGNAMVCAWGPPGVGKSHLLHATANAAIDDGCNVVLLSGEEFANGYQEAMRTKTVAAFQQRLRGADLLAIDDLHYLAGRSGTLDELVHTTEAIVNRGGHVVLASEEHPATLELPYRLQNRLLGGLVVGIGMMGPDERRCFVEHVARLARASLPPWCIDRVAAVPSGCARLIRGAVHAAINLDRCGGLEPGALDEALARLVTREAAPANRSAAEIVEMVATLLDVPAAEICGRSRKPLVRDARAITVAVLAELGRSQSQIAALMGGRHSSTISGLAARGKVLLDDHPGLKERVAS